MTDLEGQNSDIPRTVRGRFAKGGPGRPKGSRNRLNAQLMDAVADLTSLSIKVLRDQLEQSNVRAAMYVLDRFLPSERLVQIDSIEPNALIDALHAGELTPSEANRMAQAHNTLASASEVKELMARLSELEARFGLGGSSD